MSITKIFIWLYSQECLFLWQKSCSTALGLNTYLACLLFCARFISPCVLQPAPSQFRLLEILQMRMWGTLAHQLRCSTCLIGSQMRKKNPKHSVHSLSFVHLWSHSLCRELERPRTTTLITLFECWGLPDSFLHSLLCLFLIQAKKTSFYFENCLFHYSFSH